MNPSAPDSVTRVLPVANSTLTPLDHKNLLRHAHQTLRRRKIAASDSYKRALLVASNAVQSARMLQNLFRLLQTRCENHAPHDQVALDNLQSDVIAAEEMFEAALHSYDDTEMFNAEGRIEQLTLTHDPFYLEGEEVRKRKYFAGHQEKGTARKANWASMTSSRILRLLKGDLEGVEEVTEEDQRSCISKCAWGFAIIGMIVAISFLIVDFWSAQANPAISTKLYRNDALTLPVVYGCLSVPHIPTFMRLDKTKYWGEPLWGLRSYTNVDTNHSLIYPGTNLLVEDTVLGDRERCTRELRVLSRARMAAALDVDVPQADKCFACLRFGARTPVELQRQDAERRSPGAVTLEFSTSRDLEFCFNPHSSLNPFLRNALLKTLTDRAEELEQRGVVVLIAGDSVKYALQYGFEDYGTAFPTEIYRKHLAQATVLCNLYFFSGLFFPIEEGTGVRYSYDVDGGLNAWQRLGNASNFMQVQSLQTIYMMGNVSRETILKEMSQEEDVRGLILSDTSIHVYTVEDANTPPGAFTDFATSLRENHQDVLLVSRHIDSGVVRHTTSLQLGIRRVFEAMGRFRRYNISLDFETFETEVVTRRPTTSTPEFLTDVFEYIGLFTGICAYSVLVGPARMYLRRSRQNEQGSRPRVRF